jgi:hypothetical protein
MLGGAARTCLGQPILLLPRRRGATTATGIPGFTNSNDPVGSLSNGAQSFGNVGALEVWEGGEDLVMSHAVGDHGYNRRHGYA